MTGTAVPAAALQAGLAAEHAAVYVYGVLGGRVSATQSPAVADRLRAAYAAHRARRDHLRGVLAAAGETPEPAAGAYDVDVSGRAVARLLAVARLTEDRCAEAHAALVAASEGPVRAFAVEALTESAVLTLGFEGEPTPFPGAPEL